MQSKVIFDIVITSFFDSPNTEFLPLKQTSPVKLDQKDRDGRTALHYVASPHSEGTFNNGEMASLLLQNGCTLQRSKSGLNAYQEAVEAGAAIVARLVKAKFKLPAGGSKVIYQALNFDEVKQTLV